MKEGRLIVQGIERRFVLGSLIRLIDVRRLDEVKFFDMRLK
jgi:hypothetical protein